jgi:hypothetical protein
MIPRLKTEGYSADGIRAYPMGGGGSGGGGQPTQSTVTNTNIPEYARPYVETMLGATQQQLFNTTPNASGGTDITGIKPYQPYSQNPSDYVAGFSPLQQQSFQGAANLGPAAQIGQGSALAGGAGIGGLNVAGQANATGFQNQVGNYMNPYLQMALAPQLAEANRQYDVSGAKQQAAATGAGAFGGSREAIMAAENERNRNMGLQNIVGQGYNTAFGQAQNQYNQNLQNQLAGYGMANQAAGQLGQLGQTQFGQQQGVIGLQNQMGAQQQAQQQGIINQGIQNYATAQQYPQQQLAFMNSMLRGLPLQTQTVQGYQAAPSTVSQLAGLGTAGIGGLGLYNAMNK